MATENVEKLMDSQQFKAKERSTKTFAPGGRVGNELCQAWQKAGGPLVRTMAGSVTVSILTYLIVISSIVYLL